MDISSRDHLSQCVVCIRNDGARAAQLQNQHQQQGIEAVCEQRVQACQIWRTTLVRCTLGIASPPYRAKRIRFDLSVASHRNQMRRVAPS